MDKALAAVALATSAVIAILVVIVNGEPVYVVPALLAVAAGILAFIRRGTEGIATGAVLVLAGLVATVLVFGEFTFKGGASAGTTTASHIGLAWAVTAGLLVPAAVAFLARDLVEPWMPLASGLGIVLALVFLWVGAANIGQYWTWTNWLVALGALVAAVPAFGRMRIDAPARHETRATG